MAFLDFIKKELQKVGQFGRKYPTPFSYYKQQVMPRIQQQIQQKVIQPNRQIVQQIQPRIIQPIKRFVEPAPQLRARDVVREIPNAANRVIGPKLIGEQIIRPILKEGVSAGLTLKKEPTYTAPNKFVESLVGKEPVKSYPQRQKESKEWLEKHGVKGKAAGIIGGIGVGAMTLGNITPFVPEGKGLKVAEAISKTSKVADITKLLKTTNISEKAMPKIAETLSKVSDVKKVGQVISKAEELMPKIVQETKGVVPKVIKPTEANLINKITYQNKLSPEYKNEIANMVNELDVSTAGQRIYNQDLTTGQGSNLNVIGQKSTFPDWIPSNLRQRKYVDQLLNSYDMNTGEFIKPKGKAGELFNSIQNELNNRTSNKYMKVPVDLQKINPEEGTIIDINKAFGKNPIGTKAKQAGVLFSDIQKTPVNLKISTGGKLAQQERNIPIKLKDVSGVIKPKGRGGLVPPSLNLGNWKDKQAFLLSRETLERNIEKVAGKDAPIVKQFITEPIKVNETNRANFINKVRTNFADRLRNWGIGINSREDKLIQRFGEGNISLQELQKATLKWQQVQEASGYFRKIYDNLLEQINTVRTANGYEAIPKRADYFRHFQELGTIFKNMGVVFKENKLPTEISGLTNIFRPGKPFTNAELQRIGGKFTESAIQGMDNYLDSVSKQIFHTDSVQRVRALEKYIRFAGEAGKTNLPDFVANLGEYGNLVAGKKATLDRSFESIGGRGIYSLANMLRSRTSGNMIGGNISSALTNFIPFTQSLSTTSKTASVRGIFDAMISPLTGKFNQIDDIASSFLTRRYPKEAIQKKMGEKVASGFNWLFKTIDEFSAKSIVAGKYYEGLQKGLSKLEAMRFADDFASRTITDRSWGQLPNLMNTRTMGPITQFQTEINNMFSNITHDFPRLANSKLGLASSLGQFVIYSYLFNSLFEKVAGRRPSIDPIYAALTIAGVNEEGKDKSIGKRLALAGYDIGGNLPFTGGITGGRLPISAGIPDIYGALKGTANWKRELAKPAYFLLPPFGGLQAKKTYEGLRDISKGFSESAKGLVRYPIKQTATNYIKGGLFGATTLPEAREYFNKERAPLGEKESELFKLGVKDVYNQALLRRQVNKERDAIKENKAKVKSGEVAPGIFQLSDGTFYSKADNKSFDNQYKLGQYQFEKTNGANDESKAQYTLDYQRAKRNKDLDTYLKISEDRYNYLEQYKTLLDPVEDKEKLITIQNEQDDITYYAQLYAGYGGFTKPKKGKVAKAKKMKVTRPTATHIIKAPTAPKISLKISAPKQIAIRKAVIKKPKMIKLSFGKVYKSKMKIRKVG